MLTRYKENVLPSHFTMQYLLIDILYTHFGSLTYKFEYIFWESEKHILQRVRSFHFPPRSNAKVFSRYSTAYSSSTSLFFSENKVKAVSLVIGIFTSSGMLFCL